MLTHYARMNVEQEEKTNEIGGQFTRAFHVASARLARPRTAVSASISASEPRKYKMITFSEHSRPPVETSMDFLGAFSDPCGVCDTTAVSRLNKSRNSDMQVISDVITLNKSRNF
jgi:hypothetical protein